MSSFFLRLGILLIAFGIVKLVIGLIAIRHNQKLEEKEQK